MRTRFLVFVFLQVGMMATAQKVPADLLVHNAVIYTIDEQFSVKEAMVVKAGKILATGTSAELKKKYDSRQELDARGKFVYPGFIDAHAHFLDYGLGLQTLDLTGTQSWEAVLEKLKGYAATHPEGWLQGWGWDQNDWEKKEFPSRDSLDKLFPGRPVFLTRVDGHAAIANGAALGNLSVNTKISGGELGVKDGALTGILVDNAIGLVSRKIPSPSGRQKKEALLNAQANCFAAGLTTIDDCGLNYEDVLLIEALQKEQALKMRLYVMLSDREQNYRQLFQRGIIKTDRLHVRSFKVYADGALGSRGACLLEPYSDKPASKGFLMNEQKHYSSVAAEIYEKGFQMCTHAIGDSGNRVILNTYGALLKDKNDRRWRIEHAQVVNQHDFDLFGKYSIIPSVQPTHATSDMYWAGERLGDYRVKGAYAYNQLMGQNGWLALGTDFPVENISPIKTFYAACIRKDSKGWPQKGYQVENALSREDALRGMTIWAAKANFEEEEKGSLEAGKLADFILLDQDLLKTDASNILATQVLQTFVQGEKVY